jgi:hypothetical protein
MWEFPHMHGFRALLLAMLVGVAVGALAWYVVAALGHLLRVWLASGCSVDLLLRGVRAC